MKVSLQEFIRTDKFGALELGISRAQIEAILGAPDAWTAQDSQTNASIWKYGDVEFYFQNNTLWMIFMDDFTVPNGGSKIELEPWIISGQLTLSRAEKELKSAAIAYRKTDFLYNENGVHLIAELGVTLAFAGENPRQIRLRALDLKADL